MMHESYILELFEVLNPGDKHDGSLLHEGKEKFKKYLCNLSRDAEKFLYTKSQLKKLCQLLMKYHPNMIGEVIYSLNVY